MDWIIAGEGGGFLKIGTRSSYFKRVTFNIKPETKPTLNIFQIFKFIQLNFSFLAAFFNISF